MRAPVSCCIITRDDESTLEICLKSIRPHVEELIIVDNGSVDSTPEIAKRYADVFKIYTACNDKNGLIQSFSELRNYSFSLASQSWIIWFDADDEAYGLENLESLVMRLSNSDDAYNVVLFPYEYSYDEVGNPTLVLYRERLVPNHAYFKWHGDVHEVLTSNIYARQTITDDIKVCHRRHLSNKKTESGRNLRILRKMFESDSKNLRTLYYLGNECGNNGLIDEAIRHLGNYIKLSQCDDEKYIACLTLATHHRNAMRLDNAIEWLNVAVSIHNNWGEAYFELAKCFYHKAKQSLSNDDWGQCVSYAKVGLTLPPTQTSLFINPLERSFEIHKYLNVALNALGLIHEAKQSVDTALQVKHDVGLSFNRDIYTRFLTVKSIEKHLDELIKTGADPSLKKNIIDVINGKVNMINNDVNTGLIIPECQRTTDTPTYLSFGTMLSMFQSIWKTLMTHDELLSARHLMQAVPWYIREFPEVEEMQLKTDSTLSYHDNPTEFIEHYSQTVDYTVHQDVSAGIEPWDNRKQRWEWLVEALNERESALGQKLDVLDIGCSNGWFSNRIGQLGHRAHGIDTSLITIAIALSRAVEFNTGAKFANHDFASNIDPVPSHFPKKYDIIVFYEVYEHLHETTPALKKMHGLLKPGGLLLVSTPRGSWSQGVPRPGHHTWDADTFREHIRAVTTSDLRKDFIAAGFHGFKSSIADGCLTGIATLLARGSCTPIVEHIQSSLDIVIYTGWNVESWTPVSVGKTGIGGSETATVYMAKLLAKKGNRIRVYGECKDVEGIYEGVEYVHHTKFHDITCDVLVISRRPQALDAVNVVSKTTLMWLHDIHCGPYLTCENSSRVDKFLSLSQWHRDFFLSCYNFIDPTKVIVTRNGIDITRFIKAIARNPHRAVYSSSPDRGLETVVRCWSKVRESVPDAELHVYYGFDNWEAYSANDPVQKDTIKRLRSLLKENEKNGVYTHGRVNQDTLAREYLKSGVWVYPTWFSETSCISAMEAHAAGLRMITSPIAALNETVGSRGHMIDYAYGSDEYQRAFIAETVKAMNKPDATSQVSADTWTVDIDDRHMLQQYAREHFLWNDVADEWQVIFERLINC